jgi:predicted NUDIX family NTP pyrophosphohydrolase
MPKISAGLLIYRRVAGELQVLLVHPGGPFWAKKDAAAWSIPKGEVDDAEELLAAAIREFTEETGFTLARDDADFVPLAPVKQKGGKTIHAFALEVADDLDLAQLRSNTFEIEWPPHSGRRQAFPEIDRAAWYPLDVAAKKMHTGQVALLDQLREIVAIP